MPPARSAPEVYFRRDGKHHRERSQNIICSVSHRSGSALGLSCAVEVDAGMGDLLQLPVGHEVLVVPPLGRVIARCLRARGETKDRRIAWNPGLLTSKFCRNSVRSVRHGISQNCLSSALVCFTSRRNVATSLPYIARSKQVGEL